MTAAVAIPVPRGPFMQLRSGVRFHPLDPRPEDFNLDDIAHALAREVRWNGHTPRPYSVAQHSVLVSDRATAVAARSVDMGSGSILAIARWALLHDASEAYLKDIPRPLKVCLPEYAEIERRVVAAICERFGLRDGMPAEVKRADEELLATEASVFFPSTWQGWGLRVAPLAHMADDVEPWGFEAAEREFRTAAARLGIR